jgi:hypothetical protein
MDARREGELLALRSRASTSSLAFFMAWLRLLNCTAFASSAGVTASNDLRAQERVAMAVYMTVQNDWDTVVFVAWEHERQRQWTVPTGGSVVVRSFDGRKWAATVEHGVVVSEWIVRIAAGWNQTIRIGTQVDTQVDGVLIGDDLVREIGDATGHDRTLAGASGRLTLISEALIAEWSELRVKSMATPPTIAGACTVAAAAVRLHRPRWLAMLVGLSDLHAGASPDAVASAIGECFRRIETAAPQLRVLVFSVPSQLCAVIEDDGPCSELHARIADLNRLLRVQIDPAGFAALQLGSVPIRTASSSNAELASREMYVDGRGSLTHVGIR